MSQSSKYRLHRKTLKRLRLADDPDLCYVCVPLTPSVASKSGDVVLQQTSLLQGRVTSPSSQEYGVAEVVDVFLEDVPQTDHQQTGPPQAEISEVAQVPDTTAQIIDPSIDPDDPHDIYLKLASLAARHNLTDVCVQDIIALLKDVALQDVINNIPRNLNAWESTFIPEDGTVTYFWQCTVCQHLHSAPTYTTLQKLSCCDKFFSQSNDHFVSFSLKHVLELTLPILKDLIKPKYYDRRDLQLIEKYDLTENDIIMTLNTDGSPRFKSSNSSLWPILGYVNGLFEKDKKRNILLLGVWTGKSGSKPDFQTFMKPLVSELIRYSYTGFEWKSTLGKVKKSRVFLSKVLCDSIARAPVMGMMQFNAEYGCCYCFHKEPGPYFEHTEYTAPPRTDTEHRIILARYFDNCNPNQRVIFKGVVGASAFSSIPYFDAIAGFPPDILHLGDLGVTKHLTDEWTNSRNHGKPFYLEENLKTRINNALENIKPPYRVSRVPRSLQFMKYFKAHEWNMWLLYYSPILLHDVLPRQYYVHWILLVDGLSVLVKEHSDPDELHRSRKCLEDFSRDTLPLYGRKSQRFNVHLLRHVGDFVELYGSLQKNSMSCFESYNMTLRKYVSGSQSIVSQITKRYFRELTVNKYNPTAPPHRSNTMNATGEYKLLHEISANVMEPFIRNTRRNHVSCQLRCYRTFVSTKGTVYHSQLYYRVQRRESFHVCTNMNDIFTIKLFVRDNTCNTVAAVGTVHKIRPCFNLEHIFEGVSSIAGEIHTGEINDLVLKVVYNNCLYFCKFLNNFSHICE